ncbi:MAG: ParA family protein [Desulfobacterales bacterium]|nr:ParA family protein [Desulfobacterales bacterium]
MIPQEIRLFSWVDVEDVLLHVRKTEGWPHWLKSAQAYIDGLTLSIDPGKRLEAVQWLADTFAPRFREPLQEMENAGIILEGIEDIPRQLDIVIIESDDELSEPRFRPMLARPEIIRQEFPKAEPDDFPEDFPQMMALHSFKGGVGRTLNALAIAKALAEKKGKRVLLIDADLEAPGITWLLKQRMPNPAISFADVLALLHEASDSTIEIENTLRLIAERVQTSCLDNIYILPAFRSVMQFGSLQIQPEHLIQNADNPYIITHALSQLGKMLGVSTVIADLRAGLSELSAGFLLDPRVHRIFVTTLNPQSIEGTDCLLCLTRELMLRKPDCRLPKIIFSQIPPDKYVKEKESIAKYMGERFGLKSENMILTAHEKHFTKLENFWDDVMEQLNDSILFSALSDWIIPGDIPLTGQANLPIYNFQIRKGALNGIDSAPADKTASNQ